MVLFALNTIAIRYLFIAGTAASGYFPDSVWIRHACVLSGIALSLVVSYLLFRTIVKYSFESIEMKRHEPSNHALELTAARTAFTSSMTTFFSPHLMLAVSGRSSACSC